MDTSTVLHPTVLRTEPEPCSIRLDIEVPAAEVRQVYDRALDKFRGTAAIPGFRAGKAPRPMIVSRFRKGIEEETKRGLFEDAVKAACEQEKLVPETVPQVDKGDTLTVDPEASFVFSVRFDVAPPFELPDYRHLALTLDPCDVDDHAVEDFIGNWLKQRAVYERVERAAQPGDMLKVTYHGRLSDDGDAPPEGAAFLLDSEGTYVSLREADIIPGTTAALIGAVAGETREFDVRFPAEFAEPALSGRQAHYSFAVLEVHAAQIPELTDELAKTAGAETVDGLRQRVRSMLEVNHSDAQEQAVRRQVIEQLMGAVDFPLPSLVLKREIYEVFTHMLNDELRRGQTQEQVQGRQRELLEQARAMAQARLKRRYILERVADAESITVAENEITAAIEGISRYQRVAPKILIRRLRDEGRLGELVVSLRETKALEHLARLATDAAAPAKKEE